MDDWCVANEVSNRISGERLLGSGYHYSRVQVCRFRYLGQSASNALRGGRNHDTCQVSDAGSVGKVASQRGGSSTGGEFIIVP